MEILTQIFRYFPEMEKETSDCIKFRTLQHYYFMIFYIRTKGEGHGRDAGSAPVQKKLKKVLTRF